jgi:8-oxo-dGTP pyrophosphatase MutT (NUDIX family)
MPARVQVRAVIWVGDQIVVHRTNQHGAPHVTIPGGRVNERESVIDAVRREVREEIGIEITVGDLMFAAEILSGARRQDVELVFSAEPLGLLREPVNLVDPKDPGATVLPPILEQIAEWHEGVHDHRWLGNIYASQPAPVAPAPET